MATAEKLKAILVPGLAELLREAEANPDIHAPTFLAEYLMRHNPKHGASFPIREGKEELPEPELLRAAAATVDASLQEAAAQGER